jgi:hypothetical protein
VGRWPLAVMGRHAEMNGRTIIQVRHIGSPNRSVQARGVFAIDYILTISRCQALNIRILTPFLVFTCLGKASETLDCCGITAYPKVGRTGRGGQPEIAEHSGGTQYDRSQRVVGDGNRQAGLLPNALVEVLVLATQGIVPEHPGDRILEVPARNVRSILM